MATEQQTQTRPEQDLTLEQKVARVRDIMADAPEIGRTALENVLQDLPTRPSTASRMESAGRAGSRVGKVSELTLIFPLAEAGGDRLRALLPLLGGFEGADRVGSVHDMRFVLLDNDTKLLFATAYDGDWDPYIDDFATKIPDYLDVLMSAVEGWPGIRSPEVKDFLTKHQITAAGWYVANPDLTVAETRKLKRIGGALDEFLDKVGT